MSRCPEHVRVSAVPFPSTPPRPTLGSAPPRLPTLDSAPPNSMPNAWRCAARSGTACRSAARTVPPLRRQTLGSKTLRLSVLGLGSETPHRRSATRSAPHRRPAPPLGPPAPGSVPLRGRLAAPPSDARPHVASLPDTAQPFRPRHRDRRSSPRSPSLRLPRGPAPHRASLPLFPLRKRGTHQKAHS